MSGVISCPCASSSELCGIICSQRKHRGDHHSGSTQFNQLKGKKMPPTVFSHRPLTASGFHHQNNKMQNKKIALDPDSFKYSLKNRVCIKVSSWKLPNSKAGTDVCHEVEFHTDTFPPSFPIYLIHCSWKDSLFCGYDQTHKHKRARARTHMRVHTHASHHHHHYCRHHHQMVICITMNCSTVQDATVGQLLFLYPIIPGSKYSSI